ncbi:transcriptional regulator [Mycobacterium avium]|uniref:transcriptional regulator n=1 Tax=Mycobacterium avium TaxID=1764 RepID=UPI001155A9A3|nr:transcriptional regulator [Mycobacterium avium]MDO2394747.1 transcriptional regulator [Mycobacterium avium subsp. hominissuis]
MAHRFAIRRLGALPWPHGLGKNAGDTHPYKKLDTQLGSYLGDGRYDPAVHRRAYQSADPEYRRIVLDALNQMPWSIDLLDDVDAATTLARSSSLFDQPLPDDQSQWSDWARPYCTAKGLSRSWLGCPADIGPSRIADGRHRITYLRFHRPPEHEILVRVCGLPDNDNPGSPGIGKERSKPSAIRGH